MRDAEVLVLGATGHIGQAVVRALLARRARVSAATRQKAPSALARLDVRVLTGDHDREGQLARWVRGRDVVVDAGAPRPLGLTADRGLGERRTGALLEAVTRAGATLAFMSSFTTLPRPASAGSALRRSWYPYFDVKQGMERAVLEAAAAGTRALVLNPAACLGPWEPRSHGSSLVGLVLDGRLPWVMDAVVNVIDVRDVAELTLAAIEHGRTGVRIPLAGHDAPLIELTRRLAREGGVTPPAFAVPVALTSLTALWAEVAFSWVGRAAPDAWQAVPLLAEARPMPHEDAQRALGVPLRPLDRTVRDAVAWHRGRFPEAEEGVSATRRAF